MESISAQLNELQITQILTAITSAFAAILGVYVAYQQYRLGRERHKLDLFDRRMKVYEAVTRAMMQAYRDEFSHDEYFELRPLLEQAVFLFGTDIERHLQILGSHLTKITFRGTHRRECITDEDVATEKASELETKKWIEENLNKPASWFAPYLRIYF
jgi:hypothetical protein